MNMSVAKHRQRSIANAFAFHPKRGKREYLLHFRAGLPTEEIVQGVR